MSRRDDTPPWSHPVRLLEIVRMEQPLRLSPDEATRARIAKALDLAELQSFSAEVRLVPWHDGVELQGRWSAKVAYRCGLTLEPFDAALDNTFTLRAVPPDSPLAKEADEDDGEGEIELDLDADDPPDVLEGNAIDVGVYLVEHLALELDPFPRKPGAVFDAPPPEEPESPFAVLRRLKPAADDEKA